MAPSLREIRQALTRKRRVPGNGAPAEKRAVAKVKRAKAPEAEAREPSPAQVSQLGADAARRVGADERRGQREAGGGNSPRSPSPVPSPPPVIMVDPSPEQGVETHPSDARGPEPSLSAAQPAPEAVTPFPGAEAEVPPSSKVPSEGGSRAESSSATIKPSEGGGVDLSFQSILRCGRWAEETMNLASVPELQGFLKHQKRGLFFREASAAHLWAFNSMTAMRNLWNESEIVLDHAREEMGALRSRAERAEMALEDIRAATTRALQAQIEALRLKAEKAEDALEVAQRQAANELDNAQVAEEKQRLAEEKQRLAEEQLQATESEKYLLTNRLHSATIEIKAAEERAENAEEIARHSDAKVAALTAAATEAEKKAAGAQHQALEAERRAAGAVEEFRQSAAYNQELAESTAFAYAGGFQECKERIQKLYNLEGLEGLEPEEVSDDDASSH